MSHRTPENGWRSVTFRCGHTAMVRKETLYRAAATNRLHKLKASCLACKQARRAAADRVELALEAIR